MITDRAGHYMPVLESLHNHSRRGSHAGSINKRAMSKIYEMRVYRAVPGPAAGIC